MRIIESLYDKGGVYFDIVCWLERLQMRWRLFWDYHRYQHVKKFRERWRKEHSFAPDKEGYK